MARGRGGKAKRGGGHSFSRDLVLNENGVAVSNERRGSARKLREEGADPTDDDSDASESTEEESEEEVETAAVEPSSSSPADPAAARATKRAQKQQAKTQPAVTKGEDEAEEEGEDLANPNHAAPKKFKASDLVSGSPEPSRREREAKEKKEAQDRYWKLHAAGKTDQAKSDLARLAAIRKQREEAAAKRKAEQAAKEAEIEAKKVASSQKR